MYACISIYLVGLLHCTYPNFLRFAWLFTGEAILKIPDAQVFPFADLLRVCMTRSDLINSNVIEDFSSLLGPLSDRLFAATFPSTNPSGFLFIQAVIALCECEEGIETVYLLRVRTFHQDMLVMGCARKLCTFH